MLAQLGRLDQARAMLEQARAEVQNTGERYVLPLVLLHDAKVRALAGEDASAIRPLLDEAAAEAESQGAHAIATRIDRETPVLLRSARL
jgi:hypothetical protein